MISMSLVSQPSRLDRKKDKAFSEPRIIWTPAVTTIAVLLLLLNQSLPKSFSVTAIAEVLVQGGKVLKSASKAKEIPSVVSQPFEVIWDEPKNVTELFGKNSNSKIIWAYWDKGLEAMPEVCQYSVLSWKLHNPDWEVIILDDDNYQQYVSVLDLPTTFFSLKVQHRSDLLRLAVLLRYGGVYMDASTFLFKGLDDIWEEVDNDKLMLTSLNQLGDSGLDLFNNGLLMTKGLDNKVLRIWQQQILRYTEAPSLSLDEMKTNPMFERVVGHWDHPGLGMLADMVPYHSNLWMLNDLIWNEESVADLVISLPKLRWGFWFHLLPYLADEGERQRKTAIVNNLNSTMTRMLDASEDPNLIPWDAFGLFCFAAKGLIPYAFEEDRDLALRILENAHAMKFTSHDIGLVETAFRNFGLDNTLGYVYRAATNTSLFPIHQATLDGAVRPNTIVDMLQKQQRIR